MASTKAFKTPSVPLWHQMPSIFGSVGKIAAVFVCDTDESHMPV